MASKLIHRVAFPLGGAVLMALASCGSDGQSIEITNPSETIEPLTSPIDLALGIHDEVTLDAVLDAEEKIVDCMADKGFEYIPQTTESHSISHAESQERSYIEEWGFGLSTKAFTQEAVGPELNGYREELHGAYENPNRAIVDALEPSQQESYDQALYGRSDADQSLAEGASEDDSTSPGCAETNANAAVLKRLTVLDELESELQLAFENLETDPRLAQLDENISECVSKAGYQFESESTVTEGLAQQLENDFDLEGIIDRERDQLTEEETTKLAALQSEEIAMAKTFYDCGYFAAYERELIQIRYDYEQSFVDANRETLQQYKD